MIRWGAAFGLAAVCWAVQPTASAQELKVGITAELAYVDVLHDGKRVRIQRIQDTNHRLIGGWARTSRPCPPSCIAPMHSAPGVDTLGELELLDFLMRDVRAGSGLLLDARLPEEFQVETIPSAVNIPFSVVRQDNPHLRDILVALGARWTGAQWDFGAARSLLVFCAGAWSGDASQTIRAMLSMGYPANKLKYYRGGMQSWRSLGLTTVVTGPGR